MKKFPATRPEMEIDKIPEKYTIQVYVGRKVLCSVT
jgi:hypothetical protein